MSYCVRIYVHVRSMHACMHTYAYGVFVYNSMYVFVLCVRLPLVFCFAVE